MKKATRAALALLLAVLLAAGASLIALAQDYTPDTPINYSSIDSALFKSVTLTTGTNPYGTNDNWKYYYRCNFTPQYSADYSCTMESIHPVGVDIYDSEESLLASDICKTLGENRRYSATATYYLEKGKTYYFKLYFTGGHYDSCGKFDVSLKSGGSPDFPGAENLTLYVGDSIFQTVYELSEYSYQTLFYDLSLLAVFADGSFFKWQNSTSASLSIRGVDIILDMSDCTATLGKHTVRINYMGYEATASYTIVECVHNFGSSFVKPTWLTAAHNCYECTKCGYCYEDGYTLTAREIYAGFTKYYSATENEYFRFADMNDDGSVNLRDYSLLRSLYTVAKKDYFSHFGSAKGGDNYSAEFDVNSDGVINMRDYSLLIQSKPKE